MVALGGRPGVESARWAEDGVAQLLAELDGAEDRRGRYVCELVATGADGERCGHRHPRGDDRDERRGDEGFGYDPIFVPAGEVRTVAELGNAWKRSNSHRARAAAALLKSILRHALIGHVRGQTPDMSRSDLSVSVLPANRLTPRSVTDTTGSDP